MPENDAWMCGRGRVPESDAWSVEEEGDRKARIGVRKRKGAGKQGLECAASPLIPQYYGSALVYK